MLAIYQKFAHLIRPHCFRVEELFHHTKKLLECLILNLKLSLQSLLLFELYKYLASLHMYRFIIQVLQKNLLDRLNLLSLIV